MESKFGDKARKIVKLLEQKSVVSVLIIPPKNIKVTFKDGSVLELKIIEFTNFENKLFKTLSKDEVRYIRDLFIALVRVKIYDDVIRIREFSLSKSPQELVAKIENFYNKNEV